MFNMHLKEWVYAILIAFLVELIFVDIGPKKYKESNEEYKILTYIENVEDENFFKEFDMQKNENYIFIETSEKESAQIYIGNNIEKPKNKVEYKKDILFSPLVIYAPKNIYKDINFGMIEAEHLSRVENTALTIHLKEVLEAFEKGLDWGFIGVSADYLKGEIVINIPSEDSELYPYVVDLFYDTMLVKENSKPEERETVREQVEGILKKCKRYDNLEESIDSIKNTDKEKHEIFIGLESDYIRNIVEVGKTKKANSFFEYRPIYPINIGKKVYSDMYIKDVEIISELGETKNIKELMDNLLENSLILTEGTGWRVRTNLKNVSSISELILSNSMKM